MGPQFKFDSATFVASTIPPRNFPGYNVFLIQPMIGYLLRKYYFCFRCALTSVWPQTSVLHWLSQLWFGVGFLPQLQFGTGFVSVAFGNGFVQVEFWHGFCDFALDVGLAPCFSCSLAP